MEEFDIKIKEDELKREKFIKTNLGFVRKEAMRVCKRALFWENDDELSIALLAFNEAIDSYEPDRGNFYSLARLVIKRRLIDYFRKEGRHPIISIDDTEELDNESHPYETRSSLKEHRLLEEKRERVEAIKVLDDFLAKYKLSFSILVKNSPKHADTRNDLIKAAYKLSADKSCKAVLERILENGKVSPSKVSKVTNLSKKQVKSWQKYILALIIIFSNEELSTIQDFLGYSLGGEDK